MNVKVQKWGNSLAVRIPRPFAAEIRVDEGSVMDMSVTRDGKLVLALPRRKQYELDDLLARVTKSNIHAEVRSGRRRGRETW